jgi:tRNA(fMet)-specific endonuclease VapC
MQFPATIFLDTNIASFVIRDQHPALTAQLRKVPVGRLCLSVISEAELRYGLALKPHDARMKQSVEKFLSKIDILDWDGAAAARYASLRAEQKKAGKPLANMDLLIAAHALSMQALLVTNDASFKQVKGLKTADWTKAQ